MDRIPDDLEWPRFLDLVFGRQYQYHDTPDGQDCLKKLTSISKQCAFLGISASCIDVMLNSKPTGYGATLARMAYLTIPFVGMGAAFSAVSCSAADFRKKDDRVNWFLGGMASGAVVGAWQKSVKVGCWSAFGIGIAALIRKDLLIRGIPIFNDEGKQRFGDVWTPQRDYSIRKDPPKTWTTG